MAAGHVHAQCRVQGRQVQVLCTCSAVLHAAHQDSLEPKQQQQDGEAEHEEALGLSALELRSGHEAVSCGVAGWAVGSAVYGGARPHLLALDGERILEFLAALLHDRR